MNIMKRKISEEKVEAKSSKKANIVSLNAEESIYFEPISDQHFLQYISHFNKLMEVYQTYGEDNDVV